MGHPSRQVDDVEVNALRHLIATSFLAGTPIHRSNWQRAALQLESMIGSVPDEELATIVVECTIGHHLAVKFPRNSVYISSFLLWLNNFWKMNNLNGSHHFKTKTNQLAMEIGYNTYFLGGDSTPVTLLESCEGITRGTTGLRTWGASRVLASWCLNNHQLIKGRILELGSGIGFTASAILSSPEGSANISSYTASDYHPHVLTILHYNLSLLKNLQTEEVGCNSASNAVCINSDGNPFKEFENHRISDRRKSKTQNQKQSGLGKSMTSLDERLKFCSLMNEQLSKEELEPGEYRKWQQEEDDLFVADNSQVRVLQIDWRRYSEGLKYDVILAADVVYALHLLPYLANTIREAMVGTDTGNCNAQKIPELSEQMKMMKNLSEPKSKAYIACTRRNQETISEFLSELRKQNLIYKEIYQTTLDREESVFSFDESHLPVKIYEISHEFHN